MIKGKAYTYAELAKKRAGKKANTIEAKVVNKPKTERELLFDRLDSEEIEYKKNAKTEDLKALLGEE